MTAVPQTQVSISRRTLDIEDYIDIARRHISWIIGPLYAGIVIATMVAFFMPNVYVSQAVLRITQSQIPEKLVESTFNQQMSDRINQMWQEVVSRASLSELIQRPTLDLYKSERAHKTVEDVIEAMKAKDIQIQILGLNDTGGANGKPASAFRISFRYPERFKAQQVVSALVTKLTDANQVAQRTGVNLTNEIMTDEVTKAKEDLDKLDQELTAFKVANSGRLPEQLQLNISAQTSLQTRLSSVNDALQRNDQQKMMLDQRLQTLTAEYSQLEGSLTTTQEETAVAKEAQKNDEILQLNREIHQSDAQLAVLLQNETEQHPDVIDFKAKLKALKDRRDQLIKDDAANAAAAAAAAASKPKAAPKRALSLQAQQTLSEMKGSIDATKASLNALEMDSVNKQKEQVAINRDLASFQAKIEASPINEQKYVSLSRARVIANERYETLMKKQQLAVQGQQVINVKAGESLDLLDPASLPETPTEPDRWKIVLVGAFMGLLAGVGMAGAKEMKDASLKNLKDVRAYTNLPVLSSIPLLENALLVRRKRRLAYVAWAVAIIVGLIGTAISLYYHFQIVGK